MKSIRVLGLTAVAGMAVLTVLAARGGIAGSDPRAAIFVRKGCTDCHAVSGLGLRARHDVAPDLTNACGDVLIRYGVDLETFLDKPGGVMRMMLASHIGLNPVERDSIAQTLRALYVRRAALR